MPLPLQAASENAERRDGFVAFLERMQAVRDLMMTLQAVTYAGQQHVMHKALSIMWRDVSASGVPLTDPRAVWLTATLIELEHEARQISPRPSLFSHQVPLVVEVLLEVWSEPRPISTGG